MWLRSHPTSTRAAELENAVCPAPSLLVSGFSVRKASAVECVIGIACVQIKCSFTAWSHYRGASCPVWFLFFRLPATLPCSTIDPGPIGQRLCILWHIGCIAQHASGIRAQKDHSTLYIFPLHVYTRFSFLVTKWKEHLQLLLFQARMSA